MTNSTKIGTEAAAAYTLDQARDLFAAEFPGERCGGWFEDARRGTLVVSSYRTIPGTFGHPACSVQVDRGTGWLLVER